MTTKYASGNCYLSTRRKGWDIDPEIFSSMHSEDLGHTSGYIGIFCHHK